MKKIDEIPMKTKRKNQVVPESPSYFGKRKSSIIVFNKTGLLEDIYAIRNSADEQGIGFPEIYIIPRYVVDLIAEQFLSERQRYDFLDRDELDGASHRKLNSCWKAILTHLRKKWSSTMTISANYTYGNERDVQNAAMEIGLKVLILYKESFMSKGYSEDFVRILGRSRKFSGTKLLLYNEGEIERQIDSGMARPDQLVVVGSPRFDKYILSSNKLVQANDCKIVFFVHDIIPKENLGQFSVDHDAFSIYSNNLIDLGLQLITKAAQDFPEINFEVKTKITLASIEKITEWSKGVEFPPNLTVMNGGLTEESLKKCIAVIGFNTTALVDGMAFGVAAGVLYSDDLQKHTKRYVIDYGQGATKLTNYDDFENWINGILTSQDSSGNISQSIDPINFEFLKGAIGNTDGNSSIRALNEMISEINT